MHNLLLLPSLLNINFNTSFENINNISEYIDHTEMIPLISCEEPNNEKENRFLMEIPEDNFYSDFMIKPEKEETIDY